MSRFAKVNLLEVEDSAAGSVDGVEARFGRKHLESRDLGVSLFRYARNLRSLTAHSDKVQEEAYVVVAGSGRILLDDETQEVQLWDVIRVAPEVVHAVASQLSHQPLSNQHNNHREAGPLPTVAMGPSEAVALR
jgi:mannose-6-phosphate isomerase-like protein (cupin superfamily)